MRATLKSNELPQGFSAQAGFHLMDGLAKFIRPRAILDHVFAVDDHSHEQDDQAADAATFAHVTKRRKRHSACSRRQQVLPWRAGACVDGSLALRRRSRLHRGPAVHNYGRQIVFSRANCAPSA